MTRSYAWLLGFLAAVWRASYLFSEDVQLLARRLRLGLGRQLEARAR